MSRFTENSEIFKNALPKENAVGDTNLQEYYFSVGEYTTKPYYIGKAVDKLAELEDVLEEFGIESAEGLKSYIKSLETINDYETQDVFLINNFKSENEQLKQSQNSKAIEVLEQLRRDIWTDQQDDGWLDEKS